MNAPTYISIGTVQDKGQKLTLIRPKNKYN